MATFDLRWRKVWLALPAVTISIADFAVTLFGQPAGYWTDAAQHNEANPLSAFMLSQGPGAYLLSKVVYLLIVTAAVWLLPRLLSLLAATSFVLGHAFGALTWLLYDSGLNFYWLYLYFPGIAGLLVWQAWYYFRRLEPLPSATALAGTEAPARHGSSI